MLCDNNKNALGGLALAQPPKIFRLFEIQIMQQCFVKGRCPQARWHGLHHWTRRVCQKHALSCVQIGFTAPWFKSVTCHEYGFVWNATPLSRMHSSFLMRLCML